MNLTSDEIERLKVVFCIAGMMSLLSFPFLPLNGVYTAYEKLYAQKMFDLCTKVITVIAVVTALLLGGGLYIVVLFNAAVTFLMHLVKFAYIQRTEQLSIDFRYRDKKLLKTIFSFSVWVTLATVADRFFFTFIPSLLGIVSNTTEIAIFAVAVSVEGYTSLFASAFNNLFLPRVTKMVIAKDDPEKITDLMIKVGRIQLIVVSAIVVLMLAMGSEFIRCWVGPEYAKSYYVLVLVLIPSMVHFTQAVANEMIYATDNVKYRALVYTLGSVISIITTFILGGKYGAIGAAIGISLALFLSHVLLMNYIYYKKLKLNIWRYFRECHFKMYPPLVFSGLIGFAWMKLWPVNSLPLFLLKAGLWGLVHLVIVWRFILNPYERGLFSEYAGKLLRFVRK